MRKPVVPPDPALEADGVRLRTFKPTDAPVIVEACNDPAIVEYLPVPSPYRETDARAYIASLPGGFETGDNLQFAAVDGDDLLLASCGLTRPMHELGIIEVGYWVAPWARGRGVATTAVRLLARWALEDLGYARVELYAAVDNAPSRRVALKAGFAEEGVLRDRDLARDGRRRDMALYSMVRGDLEPRV